MWEAKIICVVVVGKFKDDPKSCDFLSIFGKWIETTPSIFCTFMTAANSRGPSQSRWSPSSWNTPHPYHPWWSSSLVLTSNDCGSVGACSTCQQLPVLCCLFCPCVTYASANANANGSPHDNSGIGCLICDCLSSCHQLSTTTSL